MLYRYQIEISTHVDGGSCSPCLSTLDTIALPFKCAEILMSAKSPSNISYNPSEVVCSVSEPKDNPFSEKTISMRMRERRENNDVNSGHCVLPATSYGSTLTMLVPNQKSWLRFVEFSFKFANNICSFNLFDSFTVFLRN